LEQGVSADSGYVGQPFAQGVRAVLDEHVTVQIAKRSELHTFKVMPKRWVVERSFAWLEKQRRRWKNYGGNLTMVQDQTGSEQNPRLIADGRFRQTQDRV
jgi:transposase